MPEPITVAVVTGNHPFDVPGFHRLFRDLPGVDAYIQDLDNFALDWGGVRKAYDVALFFNMHMALPADTADKPSAIRTMIEELGETGQGIVVLHHALLAWPDCPTWSEIVGIPERGFSYFMDQSIRVQVACGDHPITEGLAGWDMVDETYTMRDAGEGSQVLLTVEHPRSMGTVAWTRQHRNSRVFCLQLGHDKTAWEDQGFCEVLSRGIRWAAGRA